MVENDKKLEINKVADLKRQPDKKNELYSGKVIAKLKVDKIKLEKAVIKSDYKMIQKNIDLNNIATFNNINDKIIFVFAHYVNVKNMLFNRISDLKKDDLIELSNLDLNYKYKVINSKIISKNKLFNINTNDLLVLVTCTKNFSEKEYYCVYAKKI